MSYIGTGFLLVTNLCESEMPKASMAEVTTSRASVSLKNTQIIQAYMLAVGYRNCHHPSREASSQAKGVRATGRYQTMFP